MWIAQAYESINNPRMDSLPLGHSLDDVAARLTLLREIHGDTQRAFADRVGIKPTAWNNYERSQRLIRIQEARKLVNLFGVTTDWIFYGDLKGMPYDLVARLVERAALRQSA